MSQTCLVPMADVVKNKAPCIDPVVYCLLYIRIGLPVCSGNLLVSIKIYLIYIVNRDTVSQRSRKPFCIKSMGVSIFVVSGNTNNILPVALVLGIHIPGNFPGYYACLCRVVNRKSSYPYILRSVSFSFAIIKQTVKIIRCK